MAARAWAVARLTDRPVQIRRFEAVARGKRLRARFDGFKTHLPRCKKSTFFEYFVKNTTYSVEINNFNKI